MRMINSTSENLKARKVFIVQHFSFYKQLNFHTEMSMKIFYDLRVYYANFSYNVDTCKFNSHRNPIYSSDEKVEHQSHSLSFVAKEK